MDSGLVDVTGRKLYYKVEGEGPPLLVTSYVGPTAFMRHFSQNLRKHVRLVFVDQAGVEGLSEHRPIHEITMDLFMKEIEAVRDALGLEQIGVIGHSGCGPIALEYAIRYPDTCSHLVLTTNFGPRLDSEYQDYHEEKHWKQYASEYRKQKLEENIKKHGDVSIFDDFVRFYLTYGPRFWYDPDFDGSYLWEGLEFNQEAIRHIFQNIFSGFDVTESLSEVRCPVLLISCLYDFACPPSLWDDYKDRFHDCTYHLIEDSGHNPMVEVPEKFDELLSDWMKTQ